MNFVYALDAATGKADRELSAKTAALICARIWIAIRRRSPFI